MKRILALSVCATICILLSGCSTKGSQSQDTTSTYTAAGTASSTTTNKQSINEDTVTEEEIRVLMDKNIDCMENIFKLNNLPPQGKAIEANIYQVSDERFKDYESFENYVKSIYCKDTANMYLMNFPYENNPLYLNIDGKLCINMDNQRGIGYFVDWSNYKIKINNTEKDKCDFTLTAKQTEPGEDVKPVDYFVAASLIKENGQWLLNKMVY